MRRRRIIVVTLQHVRDDESHRVLADAEEQRRHRARYSRAITSFQTGVKLYVPPRRNSYLALYVKSNIPFRCTRMHAKMLLPK